MTALVLILLLWALAVMGVALFFLISDIDWRRRSDVLVLFIAAPGLVAAIVSVCLHAVALARPWLVVVTGGL